MQLQEVIARFNTTPFSFAGSGVTRRYYGLPDWEGLLRTFSERINNDRFAYPAYKSRAEGEHSTNGVLPMVASLIQRDFDEAWYSRDDLRHLEPEGLNLVENGTSPFKAELAAFIASHSSTQAEYKEEIQKLKNISKKNLAGVITTNYDCFFESLFEDYRTFVGQDELVFSAIQGIAEIYKIHGSVSEPESIVINDEDYQRFADRSKYLAAKLMTIFMEYPIIFIGYSISDPNIRNILTDIVACLPDSRFDQLQERFVFVEYKADIKGVDVSAHSIDLNGRLLNMTKVTMADYGQLFDALASKKAGVSVKLLRRFKEEIYTYVVTSAPGPLMQVASLDDPKIDESQIAISIGLQRTGEVGLCSLVDADKWYRDVVTSEFNAMGYSYDQLLQLSFETTFKGSNGILPVHKALSSATEQYPEIEKRAAKSFDDIASKTIRNNFRKYVSGYLSAKDLWDKEKAERKKAVSHLSWLPEEKMDVNDLEMILKEIFDADNDFFSHSTANEKTDMRRLIRYYDYLKWGRK